VIRRFSLFRGQAHRDGAKHAARQIADANGDSAGARARDLIFYYYGSRTSESYVTRARSLSVARSAVMGPPTCFRRGGFMQEIRGG